MGPQAATLAQHHLWTRGASGQRTNDVYYHVDGDNIFVLYFYHSRKQSSKARSQSTVASAQQSKTGCVWWKPLTPKKSI